MRVRVSSFVAGLCVIATAVTGCAGSSGGQALGLDDPVIPSVETSAAASAGYHVGDTGPGGGIVFYDAGSVQPWGQFLEAAPALWNVSRSDPWGVWCDWGTKVATSTAIGAGAANTTALVVSCAPGEMWPIAAGKARGYTGGGKSDWFLPSKDELNALYMQKDLVGGLAGEDGLWSSSQDTEGAAWLQDFTSGKQDGYGILYPRYVRPVRAF